MLLQDVSYLRHRAAPLSASGLRRGPCADADPALECSDADPVWRLDATKSKDGKALGAKLKGGVARVTARHEDEEDGTPSYP